MAKRHTQRGSTSLAIKEMQIKTTMRFHLTLVRMAIIKKSTNDKCWRGYGEKRTLLHCCWGYKLIQPLRRIVGRLLNTKKKKTKNRTTTWPCNPTLGHRSREKHDPKAYMHPSVHCSTVYNSQGMEATWIPIDRGMDKEDEVYIYNGILSSH